MSGRDLIIALDAGTSMIKAVAFDVQGRLIATESCPNVHHQAPGGRAEQDMRATWDAAAATIASLVARSRDAGERIIGLAVTGQGDGTWLIDAAGEPTGPALLWLDGRAGALVASLRATEAARRHFRETNTGLAACHQSSQLLWLARHQPERLATATTVLHCKDYLYFHLTGERVTDPSEGGFTYGSWRHRAYSDITIDARGRAPPAATDHRRQHHPSPADRRRRPPPRPDAGSAGGAWLYRHRVQRPRCRYCGRRHGLRRLDHRQHRHQHAAGR